MEQTKPMNQRNMLMEDFVSKLSDVEIVIFGIRPVDENQAAFAISEHFGEKLRFALTRACVQNDEVYEKVKTLFTKLGVCIEQVEEEKSILNVDKGKLN